MDGFGRTVKVETGYGTNPGTTLSVTETTYAPCGCTPMGKVKQVSVPRAPGGAVYWTVYTYDGIGRTTAVTQPNNAGVTQYVYAGNTVKVIDPAGKWKLFTTDALGNLRQVTEPNPAGGTFDTYYTYSTLNQLLAVSMTRPKLPADGTNVPQLRTFAYNNDQRLQSVTNPENGTTSFTYNADGSMATKTDANTQVLSYYYDTLGRLTQVKTGSYILRTLTYDANGGYGSYLAGRLAKVDYGVGNSNPYSAQGNAWTEMYSYDAAGGMLKKKLILARNNFYPHNVSGSLEASWEYDDEGKVKSIQYMTFYQGGYPTAGPKYTYTYDSMARPLSLSDGTNNFASGATYGPAGEMTALQYAGMSESRTYNEQKQLTGIAVYGLGAITYNYPATQNNGRIASMSSTMTGESVTYAYDSLNRLISATSAGQWGLDFSYDGFGNRLTQNLQTGQWQGYVPTNQQSYDMTKNRLLDKTYDNNGNMIGLSYDPATFDVENRMVAFKTDTYDYAPDNKRIYKYTPGTNPLQEVYFYAGGRKIATYTFYLPSDPDDPDVPASIQFALSNYNIYFGGKLIVSNGQGVVLDRLGSVVARAVDVNSSVFERHTYFPYGEERTSNGQPTTNNRDKFGTYFRDASTGLDYADQRYYSSQFGRFATADPFQTRGVIDQPNSLNRYAYVNDDPIDYVDIRGLDYTLPPGSTFDKNDPRNVDPNGKSVTVNGDDTGGAYSASSSGNQWFLVQNYNNRWGAVPLSEYDDVHPRKTQSSNTSTPTNQCNPAGSGFGVGFLGGANIDAGGAMVDVGRAGLSANGSYGAGMFYDSNNGWQKAEFLAGGIMAGTGSSAVGMPQQTPSNSFAYGLYGGIGGGIFFTNGTPGQIEGPFSTLNINIGFGPVKLSISWGTSNGTNFLSISPGPAGAGAGGSISVLNTSTSVLPTPYLCK
jgi:RHS repeat-associated protein